MRFKGETVVCDDCGAEISSNNNGGYEDETLCRGCASARYNQFLKSPCQICGKLMEEDTSDVWYNSYGDYAHGKCIETLSEKEIDDGEWSNEYP